MDLIYQNPFRVLGIPITASDREISKQISDLTIYADMGKPIEYDSDNYFNIIPIRTTKSINDAKQKIDQPHNKLFYALFWFWEKSNNIIDEMAFEELKNGNIEKAIEFWERETEKGITSQNKSNHKNLSVLRLGLSAQNKNLNKNHLLNSISLSGEFLANEYFEEFTRHVIGVRHSVNLLETTIDYVNEIIALVKPHLDKKNKIQPSGRVSESSIASKELLHHFGTFPKYIQDDILDKFVGKHIHNIENEIKKSEQKRKQNPATTNKTGFDLLKNIVEDIKPLLSILTKSNLKYQLIADKLADELLQCSIDYFNKYFNSNTDPGNDALKLVNYAKKIAVGDKTINRISDNLPTIQEFVDNRSNRIKLQPVKSDYDFIYNKLKELQSETVIMEFPSIARRFLESCKPKLKTIKNELGKTDNDFLEISDIVAGNAMGLCFESLSWVAKVAEEKYPVDDINKRILLRSVFQEVEPVFDLIGELEISYSKREEYTEFCDQIGFTARRPYQPRISSSYTSSQNDSSFSSSPSNSNSSSSSSNNSGCYIATMVYGYYDTKEVMVLRKFRDDVLSKSEIGLLFIKLYYRYSPTFVHKTQDIKFVHKICRTILDRIINLIKGKY
jgi:hypothetical protein